MRSDVIMEESTFDKYIKNDIKQKKKFDKEYNNFLLSEFILEKMEEENISVRELQERLKYHRQSFKNYEIIKQQIK